MSTPKTKRPAAKPEPEASDAPAALPAQPEYRAISIDEINAIAQHLGDMPTRVGLPIVRVLDVVASRRIELTAPAAPEK